jgi:hypothetical protein
LTLIDNKWVTISRKSVDDRTITVKANFIFTSSYPIAGECSTFPRRINCISDYIPDNELSSYDFDRVGWNMKFNESVGDWINWTGVDRSMTLNWCPDFWLFDGLISWKKNIDSILIKKIVVVMIKGEWIHSSM